MGKQNIPGDYITEEMRNKAKTAALHILDEMQNDGMTEADVLLTTFWLNEFAKEATKKSRTINKFRNTLSLEEI